MFIPGMFRFSDCGLTNHVCWKFVPGIYYSFRKREAMMEHLLYQKHRPRWMSSLFSEAPSEEPPKGGRPTGQCSIRKILLSPSRSLLGGGPYPPPEPMESLSITHRDYKQGGGPCWAPAPYTAPRLPAGAAPDLLAGTRPAGAGHLQHPNVRRPFQEVHEVHHPCLGPPGPAFARRPRRRPHALKAPLPPPPPGPVRGEHRMGGGQEPQWAEGITTRVSTPPPAPGTAVASRGVKEPSWPAGWPPRAPPRSEAEQILRTHVPPSIHLSVCGGSCSPWGALR
ncbi:splicing factor 1-like isoform X4 [Erythrolamprus reginae]|uniref:splicing factor 1-like isoform X4 n=1 Tax=Erythrolamprus reginae TaxID=121349 RepID=UPI00396CC6CE